MFSHGFPPGFSPGDPGDSAVVRQLLRPETRLGGPHGAVLPGTTLCRGGLTRQKMGGGYNGYTN